MIQEVDLECKMQNKKEILLLKGIFPKEFLTTKVTQRRKARKEI